MGLTARFWGVRGSIPSPGPTTVRYGGNTPCLELRTSAGRLVVLDGGTGLRPLGNALMTELEEGRGWEGDLFVTHTHWDHIQGLPFFAPLYREGTLRVWGPCVHEGELERVVREQMRPAVFPIGVDRLTAHIEINRVDERFEHSDGFELTAIACRHPGGALGYRVRDPAGGGSVVYVSDNELGLGADRESPSEWRSSLVRFTEGASVLVHDATYTPEEYEAHRGWGHSTALEAVELALECGVPELVLHHHHPERSDDAVDAIVERCEAHVDARRGTLLVRAAAEGMRLNV